MDDLFQSLTTSGHGTHTRTRPDAVAHASVGRAFGAAFDATLASEAATSPSMTDDGVAETMPQSGDRAEARVNTPIGPTGVERPLTFPPNEVQTDPAAPILPANVGQTDEAADAPIQEPMSAANIAINAQIADAKPDVIRHRLQNSTVGGPHTLPTSDTVRQIGPGQGSETQGATSPVTPDTFGQTEFLEPSNVDQSKTEGRSQITTETTAFNTRHQAFSRHEAALQARRTELQPPPNTIPPVDQDGSTPQPNTIPTADTAMPPMEPATIPPSVHPRTEQRPNTIPPADQTDTRLRPQTIPPADRKGDQLQPNTIPTADQSDVQMRPNTIPTSPEPRPNTIPTATVPIADRPETRSLNSSGLDAKITPAETPNGPLSEPAFLTPLNRNSASSQNIASPVQDTADRWSSMLNVTLSEERSSQVQTQPLMPAATAITGDDDPSGPTMPTGQIVPPVQSQTAHSPNAPMAPTSATGLQAQSSTPDTRDAPPLRTGGWTIAPASTPTPTITSAMPSIIQAQGGQFTATAAPDGALDPLSDLDFILQTAPSGVSTTALTPTVSIAGQAPSATAQVIAQQLAAALSNTGASTDAPLELALDPPELGRVRMQISEISGVMTLMIQAERPETADLMRRHLDLLAQEFAQAGLDAPSVHISQNGADQNRQHSGEHTSDAAFTNGDDPAPQAPHRPTIQTASGGLDLRL